MDAIFQYPMDYMDEPLTRFESYMERASLQLKVELEEYVESTLKTSSSTFILESAESFFEKFKKAIKLIIERLKDFIHDTKINFQKYRKEKEIEKRVDKIASLINKSDKLKSLKIKYTDYTPKAKFIKSQKKALKDLIRKPGTTAEEIKHFITRYKNELSDTEKLGILISSIAVTKIVSKAFLNGFIEGFNNSINDSENIIVDLSDYKKLKGIMESVDDLNLDFDVDDFDELEAEMMIEFSKAMSQIATDSVKVQREMVIEYMKVLDSVEFEIRKELEGGE